MVSNEAKLHKVPKSCEIGGLDTVVTHVLRFSPKANHVDSLTSFINGDAQPLLAGDFIFKCWDVYLRYSV